MYAGLPEAVGDLHKVYATTARLRDMTQEVMSAGAAAAQAAEVAAAARAEGARQASGFLFGPERSGLTNAHLADVDCVVQIPTNPSFSSLNLAQCRPRPSPGPRPCPRPGGRPRVRDRRGGRTA